MTNGIIFTQEGIPIKQSSDYQRVLDTRWKTMEIAFEKYVDISYENWVTGRNNIEVFIHGFNYLPAFEFFQDKDTLEGNTTVLAGQHVSDYIIGTVDKIFVPIFKLAGDPSTALRVKGFLRIYRVDITGDYKAPSTSSRSTLPIKSKYGVKIIDSDDGYKDFDSREVYKYLQNSKEKTLGIHQHGVLTAESGTVTIDHGLGYSPSFEFVSITNTFSIPGIDCIQPFNSYSGRVSSSTYQLKFSGGQSALFGKYAYLVFKDPVELAS